MTAGVPPARTSAPRGAPRDGDPRRGWPGRGAPGTGASWGRTSPTARSSVWVNRSGERVSASEYRYRSRSWGVVASRHRCSMARCSSSLPVLATTSSAAARSAVSASVPSGVPSARNTSWASSWVGPCPPTVPRSDTSTPRTSSQWPRSARTVRSRTACTCSSGVAATPRASSAATGRASWPHSRDRPRTAAARRRHTDGSVSRHAARHSRSASSAAVVSPDRRPAQASSTSTKRSNGSLPSPVAAAARRSAAQRGAEEPVAAGVGPDHRRAAAEVHLGGGLEQDASLHRDAVDAGGQHHRDGPGRTVVAVGPVVAGGPLVQGHAVVGRGDGHDRMAATEDPAVHDPAHRLPGGLLERVPQVGGLGVAVGVVGEVVADAGAERAPRPGTARACGRPTPPFS